MITQEQALAAADRWLNGDAPAEQRRAVRHREFGLGWVVWAALPRWSATPSPGSGARRPTSATPAVWWTGRAVSSPCGPRSRWTRWSARTRPSTPSGRTATTRP
ncbi:hypothetical protein ACFQ1I_13900 [Kitasatospora arboriphila]